MGNKAGKWQQHLKAAEASGLTLVAYAAQHRIDVRRLYEARRARVQAATGITGKQHPVAFARVKVVTPTAPKSPNPTGAKLTMQARLGNGVILSWSHDADNTQALGTVLHSLAALPCFI